MTGHVSEEDKRKRSSGDTDIQEATVAASEDSKGRTLKSSVSNKGIETPPYIW
jgi:hypothetical protein